MGFRSICRGDHGDYGSYRVGALAAKGTPVSITTVGNGILTGAAIAKGLVYRTGPVGAYSDTTGTATEIIAALGGYEEATEHYSTEFEVVNGVTHACTIVAGIGVTLTGITAITASRIREYRLVVTSPSTVTIYGVGEMTA